jgi:hypothetical protein
MIVVFTAHSVSLDGFLAGADDGPNQPLGKGGEHLFDWYEAGDVQSSCYPAFHLSPASAEVFDERCTRGGAVIPSA